MVTSKKVTAADIAAFANRPKKSAAWLPSIPEYEAVVEAYLAGVQPATLVRFLREQCGYSDSRCNPKAVGDFLQRRHPRARV